MPTPISTAGGLEAALPLHYTHIYADTAGESHFADESMPFELIEFSPQVPPVAAAKPIPTTSAIVLSVPKGGVADWHPVPSKQFNLILSGEVQVEVCDGEVRRFRAGDLIFGEDVQGKGHITRVVGNDDVYFVVFAVAAERQSASSLSA
jgi:quercetin dioxygenase-like cupin family protein